jgi:hypothetical protein
MLAAKTSLLTPAILAAAMSTACASRQYSYDLNTKDLASSGKASISVHGASLTTDNTFSEAAFLGSPVYLRQMHIATSMSGIGNASYDGALSICVKKMLVWKRSQAPPSPTPAPKSDRCSAGVRNLTVNITSGSSQVTAAAQAPPDCQSGGCSDGHDGNTRVFELHVPYMNTRVRVAITDDAR